MRADMETMLEQAFEEGLIQDATVAQSDAQRAAFWLIRETVVEAQKPEGGSIKHDVSVPVSRVPEFIRAANAAVEALIPGCRPCPFGNIGDGTIHNNVIPPAG